MIEMFSTCLKRNRMPCPCINETPTELIYRFFTCNRCEYMGYDTNVSEYTHWYLPRGKHVHENGICDSCTKVIENTNDPVIKRGYW